MSQETVLSPTARVPAGASQAAAFSAVVPAGAQVWIDHSATLRVGAEELHALLSDIDGWPSWTPGLLAILRLNKREKPRVGTPFVMVLKLKGAPPVPVPCVLLTLTPNVIEWGGGGLGSVIRHRFEISARGEGRAELRQLEYATGLLKQLTRPIAHLAAKHDLAWSREIERKFGVSA